MIAAGRMLGNPADSIIMARMPNIVYLEEHESVYDAAVKTMEYEVESLPIVKKEMDEKTTV